MFLFWLCVWWGGYLWAALCSGWPGPLTGWTERRSQSVISPEVIHHTRRGGWSVEAIFGLRVAKGHLQTLCSRSVTPGVTRPVTVNTHLHVVLMSHTQNNKGSSTVLWKALWFYEEPSPTGEPFGKWGRKEPCSEGSLRHHYRFFEELFKDMVPERTLLWKVLWGTRNDSPVASLWRTLLGSRWQLRCSVRTLKGGRGITLWFIWCVHVIMTAHLASPAVRNLGLCSTQGMDHPGAHGDPLGDDLRGSGGNRKRATHVELVHQSGGELHGQRVVYVGERTRACSAVIDR